MTDPLGRCEEYHYDIGDRLCRMTDRNGIETTYAYNLYGSTPGAANVRTMRMRYSYEYDVMGRLVCKSVSGRTLLAMTYDLNGNLISQEDISGKVIQYHVFLNAFIIITIV